MSATEMVESRATKWLLSQDNPAIRYWALRDLEGRSHTDPEVVSWRGRIASWKPVADLLREQHSEGYWAEAEDCYWPKWRATVWPLILLAELGVPRDHPSTRSGSEYFLRMMESQDRSWPPHEYPEGDPTGYRLLWEPCVTGNMARTLVEFGYGEDPRVGGMFEWLVKYQLPDGGWNCEIGAWGDKVCHSSFMSTIEPLWAFSSLEPSRWPKGGKEAVAKGCEFLLMHRLYKSDHHEFRVTNEEWTKLHFPVFYYYDILHSLRVLAALGYAEDERAEDALKLLAFKRLPDGTWPLEASFTEAIKWNFVKDYNGRWRVVRGEGTAQVPEIYASLGTLGNQNPWVTLNAIRVLRSK